MKSLNLKRIATVTALSLVTLLGTAELTTAQNQDWKYDQKQQRKIAKEQEKLRQQQARIEQERIRAEQQRQAEWNRRNNNSGNDRSNGNGYYNGNANANTNRSNRYRVNRNGTYYNTDQRGADLLRQAVNAGYQQGFQAARNDRNRNRRGTYSTSNVYQSGTYGYQNYVNQSQYQYYFRQGFQRGYQDGSNTQYQNGYNGNYQYGSNSGGVVNILGSILGQILNIQTY